MREVCAFCLLTFSWDCGIMKIRAARALARRREQDFICAFCTKTEKVTSKGHFSGKEEQNEKHKYCGVIVLSCG